MATVNFPQRIIRPSLAGLIFIGLLLRPART